MKRWKLPLAVLAAFVLAYLAARAPRRQEPARLAADFTLPDLKGRATAFSSFKGNVVLLDFWATWCGPCIEELPDLIKLHQTYRDKGFTIVAVSADEEPREVPPFAAEHKIPYPILLSEGNFPPEYEVRGIPTAFLIDRQGLILRRYVGPASYEEFAADVEKALASAPNLVK